MPSVEGSKQLYIAPGDVPVIEQYKNGHGVAEALKELEKYKDLGNKLYRIFVKNVKLLVPRIDEEDREVLKEMEALTK